MMRASAVLLLTIPTFLSRQNQTHQNAFVGHTGRGDTNFQAMLSGFKAMFLAQGFDAVTAAHKATAMAYQVIQRQAAALSFKNSFWTMSLIVVFLVPLPFVMRRPRPSEARQLGSH